MSLWKFAFLIRFMEISSTTEAHCWYGDINLQTSSHIHIQCDKDDDTRKQNKKSLQKINKTKNMNVTP